MQHENRPDPVFFRNCSIVIHKHDRSAMDIPISPSPPTIQPTSVSYAGFWKRFAAHIIDQLIMGVVGFIIFIPALMLLGLGIGNIDDSDVASGFFLAFLGTYLLFIFFLLGAQWLYFALMESKKGATLGKMALGIVVTDMNGNAISFGRASGRYFAKLLSGLTLGIGYIIAGFTQQKQALHDIIASCLVVNK
jgi:uncharacterized RDD family membrane protein YckC